MAAPDADRERDKQRRADRADETPTQSCVALTYPPRRPCLSPPHSRVAWRCRSLATDASTGPGCIPMQRATPHCRIGAAAHSANGRRVRSRSVTGGDMWREHERNLRHADPRSAGLRFGSGPARDRASRMPRSSPARAGSPTTCDLPGQAHAAFVRATVRPCRHRLGGYCVRPRMPGVLAVITGQELVDAGIGPIPPVAIFHGSGRSAHVLRPACRCWRRTRVRYVGEPVAIVVAETAAPGARRGRSGRRSSTDQLPPRRDVARAMAQDAPRDLAGGARQHRARLGGRRRRGGRCGLRPRRACRARAAARHAAGAERHGAARRARDLRRADCSATR